MSDASKVSGRGSVCPICHEAGLGCDTFGCWRGAPHPIGPEPPKTHAKPADEEMCLNTDVDDNHTCFKPKGHLDGCFPHGLPAMQAREDRQLEAGETISLRPALVSPEYRKGLAEKGIEVEGFPDEPDV